MEQLRSESWNSITNQINIARNMNGDLSYNYKGRKIDVNGTVT